MGRPLSSWIAVTTALVAPQTVRCWTSPATSLSTSRLATQLNMATPPAGSFFNPVPDKNDDDDSSEQPRKKDDGPRDLNDDLTELLRQRKSPSLAEQPSTINGVPTAKATGFGKPKESKPTKKPSKKPYVAIGTPDKKVNDPTSPEYDDQGYTLFADKDTGEKKRVFEALVDYPCEFTMKIVGASEGTFVQDMVAVVAEACETETSDIPHSTKVSGKWISITVKAPVKSAVMLYSLYEKVDLDPRVKFKF